MLLTGSWLKKDQAFDEESLEHFLEWTSFLAEDYDKEEWAVSAINSQLGHDVLNLRITRPDKVKGRSRYCGTLEEKSAKTRADAEQGPSASQLHFPVFQCRHQVCRIHKELPGSDPKDVSISS